MGCRPTSPCCTRSVASSTQRLRLTDAFPDCPPYGGAFAEPRPHLTVGNGVDDTTAAAIEADLAGSLPISFRVDDLTLLVEDDDGHWTVDRSWPLRTSTRA